MTVKVVTIIKMVDSCEHDNEQTSSIKCGEFLDCCGGQIQMHAYKQYK
jgi:hypothetical protein